MVSSASAGGATHGARERFQKHFFAKSRKPPLLTNPTSPNWRFEQSPLHDAIPEQRDGAPRVSEESKETAEKDATEGQAESIESAPEPTMETQPSDDVNLLPVE